MNKAKLTLLLSGLLTAPFSAHAIVWNTLNTNNCLNGCGVLYGGSTPLTTGNSQAFSGSTGSDPKVTVSAFSTAPTINTSNETFGAATLVLYNGNGLGATAATGDGAIATAPDHAFDNDGSASSTTDYGPGGAVDAALFAFDQSTQLSSVSIGWENDTQWSNGDADISVLAYTGKTGSMSNPADIIGKTFSTLLTMGWEFIGSYSTLNMPNTPSVTINSSNISSSYWLVSAYTNCADGNCSTAEGGADFGDDYFKIASVSGTAGGGTPPSSVPEPSSLLLLAGGLLGWRLNRYGKAEERLGA